jgi:hypothetical protein
LKAYRAQEKRAGGYSGIESVDNFLNRQALQAIKISSGIRLSDQRLFS